MALHKDEIGGSLHVGPTIKRNQADTGSLISDSTGSARRIVNLREGTNITLAVKDDSVNDVMNITISASGGGGGGATAYEQATDGSVNIGDSAAISSTVLLSGRVDLPALTTTTVNLYKGVGVPVTNIFSVFLETKGSNGNSIVHLENVAGNLFPKAGSTITVNNNSADVISCYIFAIVN